MDLTGSDGGIMALLCKELILREYMNFCTGGEGLRETMRRSVVGELTGAPDLLVTYIGVARG
jgi:hypothetical protein